MASIVEGIIRQRVSERGRITFAEFMELALYGPGGYYMQRRRTGPSGDYFTAPHAHPGFGALIAVQLREMWRALGAPARFMAVELGAGDGLLAADVASYSARLDPGFAKALEYLAFDRVVHEGAASQVRGFDPHPRTKSRAGSDPLPPRERGQQGAGLPSGATGCVMSNELLDALPVHRFTVRNGRVLELYVTLREGKFDEVADEPSTPGTKARLGLLVKSLPEGFRGEVNLGIGPWAAQVAGVLARGYVLTVDYGHDRTALYSPERRRGTLRCYYRHTLGGNPFDHAGDQDMTAHVDFSAVDEALAAHGFAVDGYASQRGFLRSLGLDNFVARLRGECRDQAEADANCAGLLELVRPDGMGAFRVAIHSKGAGAVRLTGLHGPPSPGAEDAPPLPLLAEGDRHIRLARSKYPHAASSLPAWKDLFSDPPAS